MLYSRATEENNLVYLNEYPKSTVTLGALNKTQVIEKKKSRSEKPSATKASRKSPVKTLVVFFLPGCYTRCGQQRWDSREHREGVQTGETPFRVRVTQAVTLAMQLASVSVGVFGRSLRAGTGTLGALLGLCLFSLPSPSVAFKTKSYIHRLDAFLTQVHTEDWKKQVLIKSNAFLFSRDQ